MTLAIVQHDILWGQPEANYERLAALLDHHRGADVYVLAETFATGFLAGGTAAAAASGGSEALAWLRRQAQRLDAVVAGSAVAADEGQRLRNRLFFVRPDGSYDYYDKHHLFSYAGEDRAYAAGRRRVVAEWRGVRFLLQVCYDLRFPVWSRNRWVGTAGRDDGRGEADYDVALYVANWPTTRMDVWRTLLKARALENQCFVVGVNRVGSDPSCQYSGGSVVFDAYGSALCGCADGAEGVATTRLDLERMSRFRHKFPVLLDADEVPLLDRQD